MSDNKITEIIEASLGNIKTMLDADAVIGTPIKTENGTTIIPISKISVGIATGGLDNVGKPVPTADRLRNFGGGGGTGMSVSPVAFLIVSSTGNVDLLNIKNPTSRDPVEQISSLIERSPEIVDKFKTVFAKKSTESEVKPAPSGTTGNTSADTSKDTSADNK